MTSAPVKSVDSLVNYVGSASNVQPQKAGTDNSFGTAMGKASEEAGSLKKDDQVTAAKRSGNTEHTGLSRGIKGNRRVSDAKGTESTASMEEQMQEIQSACQVMKNAVMETLNVSEEEVLQAMETLGLSMTALLDPANLSQLVLSLGGETDTSSLLTDESLFGQLQALQETAGNLREDLMQTMDLSGEELETALSDAQSFTEADVQYRMQSQTTEDAEPKTDSQEEPEVIIEADRDGKTATSATNESVNVNRKGQEADSDTDGQMSENAGEKQMGERRGGAGKAEAAIHSENLTINTLLQNKVTVTEAGMAQEVVSFTSETQEIMDQILDNLKIQLKPGMDSLQMQLHPESLGTVHVQVVSRAGEVTAQFHVQNEAVKSAVESQIAVLKESLDVQGVKVEAIEVTVDTRGFESSLWQGGENPGQEAYEKQRKAPRRINLTQLDPSFEEEASEEELLAAKLMEANGNTVDYTA